MNPYIRLLLQATVTGGANSVLTSAIIPHVLGDYKLMGASFLAGAVLGLLNHLAHNPFAVAADKVQDQMNG